MGIIHKWGSVSSKARLCSMFVLFAMSLCVPGAAFSQTININCGGPETVGTDGTVWLADKYFVGGGVNYTSDLITNTADVQLYRAARYSLYTDFYYDIPVANGNYTVKFKFAEITYWGPGYRVFHVDINGSRVLPSFDISVAAGGARKAVDKSFPVSVTNGKLKIDFIGVTARGLVNAIQIIPGSSGTTTTTPVSVALSPSRVARKANETAQFTATVSGATNTQVTWSVAGADPMGTISSSGLYTAPSSIAQSRSVTVTATSVADPTKSATATVDLVGTVTLSVSPGSANVVESNTVQFTAAVGGTSDTRVTWTASAGSISTAGLFTAPKVTAPTQMTVTARSMADTTVASNATVSVSPVTSTAGSGAFLESGGQVTMEAENANIVNRAQSWVLRSDIANFSGAGFLRAEPNNGTNLSRGYVGVGPELQFPVRFSRTGTYYVWVRGYGETDNDDSIHFGLDGVGDKNAAALSQFPFSPPSWAWSSDAMDFTRRVTLDVTTAGIHVVNAWMREDGFRIDKIILTTDSAFRPTGFGPGESGRDSGTPTLTLTPLSLTFVASVGTNPPTQTVGVVNAGGGTLSWTATPSAGWLQAVPASGSGTGTFGVTVNTGGLSAGSYSGSITVNAPGASGSPKTVAVSLTVSQPTQTITLGVTPNSLNLAGTAGAASAGSGTISISGSGGTVNWTASKSAGWLSLSQTSGSGNATITASVNATGMAAGNYTDVVQIVSQGAVNSPSYVNVALSLTTSGTSIPLPSTGYYVSPTGLATNTGSISSPWDLQTALKNTAVVKPGDTVWLRGGRYGTGRTAFRAHLLGTESAPIYIRAYPGERPIIDGWIGVGCCDQNPQPSEGAHMWFWGLEFASSITERSGCSSGPPCYAASSLVNAIDAWAPGTRFINNIIHDTAQGISWWKEALNGEAHGNLIFANGFFAPDRGHGHGIYTQNNTGVKRITDNIIFNQFGWGMHIYGSGDGTYVRNFHVEGNISFNNGAPTGGRTDNLLTAGGIGGLAGFTIKDNFFYHTPDLQQGYNEIGWQWDPFNADVVATGNYFVGGREAVSMTAWQNATFTGNTIYSQNLNLAVDTKGNSLSGYNVNSNRYYGIDNFRYNGQAMRFSQMQGVGIDRNSTFTGSAPVGVWSFVRPNKYEAGRANIVIYNWDKRDSVSVDLSPSGLAVGKAYEIRDAQNFVGSPILTGTYQGGSVSIPMRGLTVMPVNGNAPVQPTHTGPEFGVFVLIPKN